jgi:predicted dienelactone hydrolase
VVTAGARVVEIPDPGGPDAIRAFVMYPAEAPEEVREFGSYPVQAAWDAPVASGAFPLVVVSHGTGGSPLTHRMLGAHLARNGFVVALVEHPRNNRDDDSLARTATILENRPRQVSAVIDWFSDGPLAESVVPGAAYIIGHSLGGYTALALAGGKPTAFAIETPDHQPHPVPVQRDEHVKALVLFAPATAWFMARGALSGVHLPILMVTGDQDHHAPSWHGKIVLDGVADKSLVEHTVVHLAGHFSFLSPFPPAMRNSGFPPSQDPPGFDRERFHEEQLYPEALAFLKRVAGPPAAASI